MPKCMVCGKDLEQINYGHLKTHGMTTAEYREMFPDAEFCSDALKSMYAERGREMMTRLWEDGTMDSAVEKFRSGPENERRRAYGKRVFEEGRLGLHTPEARAKAGKSVSLWWVSLSDEERKTISEQRSDTTKQLWADGVLGSEEYIENLSTSLLDFYQTEEGQRNIERKAQEMGPRMVEWHADPENKQSHSAQRSVAMTERMSDPENRAQISSTLKHRWATDQDLRSRAARSRAQQANRDTPTSIELILYNILDELGVEYKPQVPIDGYTVDALVEGWLILEAYGDYWHNYPDGREHDRVRSKRLGSLGFQVFPFWEHQLNDDPSGCADRITYMVDCT